VHRKSLQTESEHTRLLQELSQLNMMRESNTTLRAEIERLKAEANERAEKEKSLSDALSPLKLNVQSLTQQLELVRKEKELVSQDLASWRKRAQELVDKYKTIDPEEHR
jgi:nucleoprotein TPR